MRGKKGKTLKYLAIHEGEVVDITRLAEDLDCTRNYMSNIMWMLVREVGDIYRVGIGQYIFDTENEHEEHRPMADRIIDLLLDNELTTAEIGAELGLEKKEVNAMLSNIKNCNPKLRERDVRVKKVIRYTVVEDNRDPQYDKRLTSVKYSDPTDGVNPRKIIKDY